MNIQEALQNIRKKELKPLYLVLGTETFLQEQVKQAFIERLSLTKDDLNFLSFDLMQQTLDDILKEAAMSPFFGDQRLIFVENPSFLTSEKKVTNQEQEIEDLLDYFSQPVETTILVFFANYEKIDERKKITKQLKKSAETIFVQPLKENEVRRYLQQVFENEEITISREAFDLFVRLTDASLSKAMHEFDKIHLFAKQKKVVDKKMISELLPPNLENNVFELLNLVFNHRMEDALRLFDDLLLQKEEPIKINAILMGQVRLYVQIAILLKIGYQQGNITEVLKIHPYRVKLAIQQVRKLQIEQLITIYDLLVENDYLIKSGKVEKKEQLILSLLKISDQLR